MPKTISTLALLFFTTTAFLLSCKSGEDTIRQTENEVFAVHDEVMPKIGDIMKLKKQLTQRITAIDSLKASGSAAATLRSDEEREQAMRLRQDLTVADSLMMGWMSNYNGDTLTKLSSDEAMSYLANQKDKINDVKTKVNSSIEQARQFLDSSKSKDSENLLNKHDVKIEIFNSVSKVQDALSNNGIGAFRKWRYDGIGWLAATNYFSTGSESSVNGMQSNLAYYLESDNEEYIKQVKLVLNINNMDQKNQAISFYQNIVEKTFSSLKIDVPNGLLNAIKNQNDFEVNTPIFLVSNKLDKSKIDTWKLTIETK